MHELAEVLVEFLPAENGGRQTPVCLSESHYRPHLRVQGGDGEYLGVEFIVGPKDAVQPGCSVQATVRLMYEQVCYDPLVAGARFNVMEGAKVVATGSVIRRK